MKISNQPSKILGAAFLLQFATSFGSAVFLSRQWSVPGNIAETMLKIASHPNWLRVNILVDLLTVFGVTFLGVVLFTYLRRQNEKIALTALGFYILESALLAASRGEAFRLLRLSQEYAASGQPADLLLMGQVAYEAMDFMGNTLHMLAFCLGGILFYFLLNQSGLVPRWLSVWGLVAVLPMLVGTLMQMFGLTLPFVFYLPYVPFELVIGLWILVRGIRDERGQEHGFHQSLLPNAG